MNKRLKRNLIEYGTIAVVLLALFLTGLHTEVFGFLQRGVLATGIMNPHVETEAPPTSEINPPADFNLKLINSSGDKVTLGQYRGKVIFINLWATWCPPCIAEMPGINNLYKDLESDADIVFLMLSLDDDFRKAMRFNERKKFSFDVYALAGPLPRMYHTQSIPTTFVIDAEGNLAFAHQGMANYDTSAFKKFLLELK